MNQPSSSLSLDLDTCSNSSDSLSECETLTVPDPNDPVTIRKFVDETVIGPISLQDQNIDQINAINSELHIGTVHKNIFHFHGNVKPPSKTNGETQQNGGDEPHHLSGKMIYRAAFQQKRYLIVTITLILLGIAYSLFFLHPSSQYNEIFEPDGPYVHRNEWKAEKPKSVTINFSKPPTRIIVKQTNETFCSTFLKCAEEVRRLQHQDMQEGLTDIKYNFLIGGDGRIYEGRGWEVPNEESTNSIDIAFIGNFTKDVVSSVMAQRAQDLISEVSSSTVDYEDLCNFVEIWNVTNIQKVEDKIKNLMINRSC